MSENDGVSAPSAPAGPTYYRLARHVVIRFLGGAFVALAVVVVAVTVAVFATGTGYAWIFLPVLVGVIALGVLAWWLRTEAYVVRCTSQGYSIRLVRGAGVREARWADVQEAVTASPYGIPVLTLRLKNGTTSTIPVTVLAIDREQFVREMQRHLSSGIRPLTR